jgi:integrase
MAREVKTRYEGVWARHRESCRAPDGGRCSCKPGPTYIARVYDRPKKRHVPSKSYPTVDAARSWRRDKLDAIDRGETVVRSTIRIEDAIERFLQAARDGTALNKKRKPYTEDAVRNLTSALSVWIAPEFGPRKPHDIRRGDVQLLVDAMTAQGLSGSRIRNVVNSFRALYTYMIARDICHASPVASIQLPAMDETPRDRVATPAEFAALIAALPLEDRVPYALAGYSSGRRSEIRRLSWSHVLFDEDLIEWGKDGAHKSRAAQRKAPVIAQLKVILFEAWLQQGKPKAGLVCPGRKPGGRNSGLLSFEALQTRADAIWEPKNDRDEPIPDEKLGERITPHECRHTCATWLDAAGVRPVVKAAIMGHSPAGGITETRYTHVTTEDIRYAGTLLNTYIAAQTERRAA